MDKQIMIYLYKEILFHNKKDQTIDITWVNLKIIMMSRKARPKRIHSIWFHFYKILENTN